jgi:hypothetical protein
MESMSESISVTTPQESSAGSISKKFLPCSISKTGVGSGRGLNTGDVSECCAKSKSVTTTRS